MKAKRIPQKSKAIRQALREAIQRQAKVPQADFRRWRGMGLKTPPNPKPKFKDDDDLWK